MKTKKILIVEKSDDIYNMIVDTILKKELNDGISIQYFGAESINNGLATFYKNQDIDLILYNCTTKLFNFKPDDEDLGGIDMNTMKIFMTECENILQNKKPNILFYTFDFESSNNARIKIHDNFNNNSNTNIINRVIDGYYEIFNYKNFNFSEELKNIVENYFKFEKYPIINIGKYIGKIHLDDFISPFDIYKVDKADDFKIDKDDIYNVRNTLFVLVDKKGNMRFVDTENLAKIKNCVIDYYDN